MKVFAIFRDQIALLLFLSALVCTTEADTDERDGAASAAETRSGDGSASQRTVQLDLDGEDSDDLHVRLDGLVKF